MISCILYIRLKQPVPIITTTKWDQCTKANRELIVIYSTVVQAVVHARMGGCETDVSCTPRLGVLYSSSENAPIVIEQLSSR